MRLGNKAGQFEDKPCEIRVKKMTTEPIFQVAFDDGSEYKLPQGLEAALADYAGQNPKILPALAGRTKFLASKYFEHCAWPCKFDGIGMGKEGYKMNDHAQLDNPGFYYLKWHEVVVEDDAPWKDDGSTTWREFTIPPKKSDIAEALFYIAMRPLLLQTILQANAPEKPQLVITLKEGAELPASSGTGRLYYVTADSRVASLLFGGLEQHLREKGS